MIQNYCPKRFCITNILPDIVIKKLLYNRYKILLIITAISQEILTISAAPAGSQEENNTLP